MDLNPRAVAPGSGFWWTNVGHLCNRVLSALCATALLENQDEDLLDYEENEDAAEPTETTGEKKDVQGSYVSIHSSGFRDFLLKPELMKAIVDCGFEHPSQGAATGHPCCPRPPPPRGLSSAVAAFSGMPPRPRHPSADNRVSFRNEPARVSFLDSPL